jgi:hypothetical protein
LCLVRRGHASGSDPFGYAARVTRDLCRLRRFAGRARPPRALSARLFAADRVDLQALPTGGAYATQGEVPWSWLLFYSPPAVRLEPVPYGGWERLMLVDQRQECLERLQRRRALLRFDLSSLYEVVRSWEGQLLQIEVQEIPDDARAAQQLRGRLECIEGLLQAELPFGSRLD